ncbi:MAG: HTTM domain-containing protein [Methylotenera sp.]|nr:HTTM domain-containing protein [Oligoflexia bacterium]
MKESLALDLRSLAVFRILLGIVILCDLWSRSRSLEAHYTDSGLVPRSLLVARGLKVWDWSLYSLSGTAEIIGLGFIVHALVAVFFLLGYRTRWMTVGCWLLTVSLINRNPFVTDSGDTYLKLLLFWAAFLPLGEVFSLDSWRKKKTRAGSSPLNFKWVGFCTAAFIFQIVMIYFFAGLFKILEPAWRNGHGVYYALRAEQFIRPLGSLLAPLLSYDSPVDALVLGVELIICVLVLIPSTKDRLRSLSVVTLIGFHLSIHFLLEVGFLSMVGSCAWVALIPATFWNRLQRGKVSSREPALTSAKLMPEALWLRLILSLMIVYVFIWNLSTLPKSGVVLSDSFRRIGFTLKLNQFWNLFSVPTIDNIWNLAPARLKNGEQINLFTGKSLSDSARPRILSEAYPDGRWRKMLIATYHRGNQDLARNHGIYLCRRWNQEHPNHERLMTFEVITNRERILSDKTISLMKPEVIWRQTCP